MKWSWLNKDKTEIIRTADNGGSMLFVVGGKKASTHLDADLIASGALPHNYDTPSKYQYLGDLVIKIDKINREIITRSEADIQNILIAEAEAFADEKVNNTVPQRMVDRCVAKGTELNRIKVMFLDDPVSNSDLNEEEESLAANLSAYGKSTGLIRDAEDEVVLYIKSLTGEELLDFIVAGHSAWVGV